MTSVGQNTKPKAKWCQPQRSQLNQNHKPETTSKNNFHFVLENAALKYCRKKNKKLKLKLKKKSWTDRWRLQMIGFNFPLRTKCAKGGIEWCDWEDHVRN